MASSAAANNERMKSESGLSQATVSEKDSTTVSTQTFHDTLSAQSFQHGHLLPPDMPIVMRNSGFPSHLPRSGPMMPAFDYANQSLGRPNVPSDPTIVQSNNERATQKDALARTPTAMSETIGQEGGRLVPESADFRAQMIDVHDKPLERVQSSDSAIAQNGALAEFPSDTIFNGHEKSRPMKHLTCFFWYYYRCRYQESNCLYAHRETGHIASAPCQIGPGKSILP